METNLRVIHRQRKKLGMIGSHPKLPERHGRDFHLEIPKGPYIAYTLDLNFWPPEL